MKSSMFDTPFGGQSVIFHRHIMAINQEDTGENPITIIHTSDGGGFRVKGELSEVLATIHSNENIDAVK